MNRVAIVGCSGAGKSTLARKLGPVLGLPVVHFDRLHWDAGWVERSQEETQARIDAAITEERWITDGNYTGYSAERLRRADLVIWLDYPRRICLRRVAKRIWTHAGEERPDMAPGCPERFDAGFVRFVWAWHALQRPGVLDRMWSSDVPWIWLRHPRQTERWVASLSG